VKLYRAARAEKVSFRQIHVPTGSRVRQQLVREPGPADQAEPAPPPPSKPAPTLVAPPSSRAAFQGPAPRPSARQAPPPEPEELEPTEVSRADIGKGYEYDKDRFVVLTKDELAKLTPQTERELAISQFVKLQDVDPIYYETSYYLHPDKGGERAYSLLYETLKQADFVGVGRLAMQRREHVVLIRPGRSGLILHTMYFENEVHREDEHRTDTSQVNPKELELAKLLVENLAGPFDPTQYRDTYREKVEALIQEKLAGHEIVEAPAARQPAPVLDILQALEQSLAKQGRKPPALEEEAKPATKRTSHAPRKRAGG
jgi:DNA end-binding protein Ku